jgi:hypothetical protein
MPQVRTSLRGLLSRFGFISSSSLQDRMDRRESAESAPLCRSLCLKCDNPHVCSLGRVINKQ